MAVAVRPDKMPTHRFIGGSRGVPRGRRRKPRVPGFYSVFFCGLSAPYGQENNMFFLSENLRPQPQRLMKIRVRPIVERRRARPFFMPQAIPK